MHIIFFVEEPSMEYALKDLLPGFGLTPDMFQIITFQCKDELLENLNQQLTAYANWVPEDYFFVVLVDRDDDDCHELKNNLEIISQTAGFTSKTSVGRNEPFRVLNRIVIEELEAWYFGDADALRAAYPGVSATLEKQQNYRDPDAIRGGTWETLERVLKQKGYFKGGISKTILARDICKHMQIERNRSKSFQVFRDGLRELIRMSSG